jgi:hypothetical protein
MRKEKALIDMLRRLVHLLSEESARNPDFAAKLDGLLAELPPKASSGKKTSPRSTNILLPDIHAELNKRGEMDFRLWLRDQPVTLLRALIREHDLDPTRRTSKWSEEEKLAEFILEGLRARMSRGGSFLGRDRSGP